MPRPKKGKARQQSLIPEGGGAEGDLAPIPEDTNGYEGYDQYGQHGEEWQTNENTWHDGRGYGDGGYPQGAQTEAFDMGQYPQQDSGQYPQQGSGQYPPPDSGQYPQQGSGQYPQQDSGQYPQQEWVPPTTSPEHAQQPPGPSAFAAWGHSYQDANGAPRPPHSVPRPSPATQPPMTLPPRSRQGAAGAGASNWRNWGAEAMAMANNKNLVPPPPQPQGGGYSQQSRVAFAGHDPYPAFGDRADAAPQTRHMMYDSITNSRVDAPKQSHQRSTRGTAQHSSKKSRKERAAQQERMQQAAHEPEEMRRQARMPPQAAVHQQERGVPNVWPGQQDNFAWDQDNRGPEQENTQWDQGGYGLDQQNADWGEKQFPGAGEWDADQVGRDDLDSEGYTDSEGWNDVTGRRNFRRTVSNAFVPAPAGNSPYPMPSRTMAYANGTLQDPLEAFSPGLSRERNTMHDYANIELLESYGEAFKPVENAFFGRDRKARDRIHWQFPFTKDERVRHALEWLHDYAHNVGAFGLNKFLQTRERGALFINASYDSPSGDGPALDWLAYEDVVQTRDRLLQESVGFYDPSMQVIVFVFLPSKSGNSLAMWRRKIAVPNSVRLAHVREIGLAKAALSRDYPVVVDEIRSPPYRSSSLQTHSVPPSTKKKKKKGFFRRLFRIFKIVW